jgi:hypothetical protein
LSSPVCILAQSAAAASATARATTTAESATGASESAASKTGRAATGSWAEASTTASATAIRRSRCADSKPAIDRARAESTQPQTVVRQVRSHSRRQAGGHLQTLCGRDSASRSTGPTRSAETTTTAHGALPPRLVIARLFEPAAHASVDQERFIGVAANVGILRLLLLLRFGLLSFGRSANRGTLKTWLGLTRCAAARTAESRSSLTLRVLTALVSAPAEASFASRKIATCALSSARAAGSASDAGCRRQRSGHGRSTSRAAAVGELRHVQHPITRDRIVAYGDLAFRSRKLEHADFDLPNARCEVERVAPVFVGEGRQFRSALQRGHRGPGHNLVRRTHLSAELHRTKW